MSDETTVEALLAYAGQIAAAATQASAAAQLQHDIVHGDASTEVVTESGGVPTLARQYEQAQEKVSAALADVAVQMAGAMTYQTVAAGLAAVPADGFFSVLSADSSEYLILYQKVSNVAVEKRRYPSKAAVDSVASRTVVNENVLPSRIPLVVNDLGQVSLWLEDGNLAVAGMTDDMKAKAVSGYLREVLANPGTVGLTPIAVSGSDVVLWLENGLLAATGLSPALVGQVLSTVVVDVAQNAVTQAMMPVAYSGNSVVLWLENGKLGAAGLSDDLMTQITATLAIPPIVSAKKSPAPIATDGATLFKYRAKLADIRSGIAGTKLRLGITGDSWTERPAIPAAIRGLFEGVFPNAGEGWQSVSTSNRANGVTMAYSGFTFIDGGEVSIGGAPTGIDGMSLSTTTAAATLTLGNCQCTDLKIYYYDNDAGFQYNIDGGAWVTVAGKGTNAMAHVDVSGLTDSKHVLNVSSAGNTSTLYLLGFYATRAVDGVELSKMGNSGAYSTYIDQWVGNVQPFAATIDLDLLIIILGTNDQRYSSSPPAKYVEVLKKLVDGYRAAIPDLGVVMICPAITSPDVINIPLSSYRDALHQFCIANGCEFYNLHDAFGPYAQANALGQFADTLHPNARGSLNLAYQLNSHFFKIK